MFEPEAVSDGVEALQSSMHCDRSWWFGIVGAAPCAETGDDPSGPRQGFGLEGVSETLGFSVDGWGDGLEDGHVVLVEGSGGRPLICPVASLDELHADDGGAQRDEGELAQDVRGFDLAILDAETLALEGAEELLDQPAAAVSGDASLSRLHAVDGSAGEQPPVHRLDAVPRIDLAHIDRGHGGATRQPAADAPRRRASPRPSL